MIVDNLVPSKTTLIVTYMSWVTQAIATNMEYASNVCANLNKLPILSFEKFSLQYDYLKFIYNFIILVNVYHDIDTYYVLQYCTFSIRRCMSSI